MRHHTRRTRAATLTGLALALAGCSGGGEPAPPVTLAPAPEHVDLPDVVVAIPRPPVVVEPPRAHNLDIDLDVDRNRDPIDRLPYQGDTDGTGPQIALRFLQALQRRDDIAAARTLTAFARLTLSMRDTGHLRAVMANVAAHARLAGAGPCTTARRIEPDAVVVHCGTRRIVVHVRDDGLPGVQIAPWHPRSDVYPGPHSHAYTDLDL